MQTIYQINANELDQTLLESIKAQFKNKEIEIVVSERDETDYLCLLYTSDAADE